MNSNAPKLKVIEQQHAETTAEALHPQQTTAQEQGRVFASAEEMLRHDAEHTPVPPQVAERLKDSIALEPKPAPSWWQRLFSL